MAGSPLGRVLDVVRTAGKRPAVDDRSHRDDQLAMGAQDTPSAMPEVGSSRAGNRHAGNVRTGNGRTGNSRVEGNRAERNRAAVVEELRAELAARPATATGSGRAVPTLPALPAFASLLPERGLRRGASYSVQRSTMLTMALLAGASRAGSWCGMVGMPGFGAEAAAGLGIDLGRLVLVPAPGRQWLNVVATLVDVLDLVVVRPPARPYDAEAQRLAARLRERGAVLLAQHPDWPGCELRLAITSSTWHGLGAGHGHLTSREVTVEATGRGTGGRARTTRLWLPDRAGEVRGADHMPVTGLPLNDAMTPPAAVPATAAVPVPETWPAAETEPGHLFELAAQWERAG
ncbi:MAG: hypothetical protein ACRDP8_10275 [Actinopolymorphaceae bacterium]